MSEYDKPRYKHINALALQLDGLFDDCETLSKEANEAEAENERLRAEVEYLEGMIDRVRELVCDHRVSDIRESENEKLRAKIARAAHMLAQEEGKTAFDVYTFLRGDDDD